MNTIPDSTLTRAYERIQTAGMDELVRLSRNVVNAISEDIDLRWQLPKSRHQKVRESWEALHAWLEAHGR